MLINSYGHISHLTKLLPGLAWLSGLPVHWACFQLWQTITLLQSAEGRECRYINYFMINLQESVGLSQDRTHDPWIGRLTRYMARSASSDNMPQVVFLSCLDVKLWHNAATIGFRWFRLSVYDSVAQLRVSLDPAVSLWNHAIDGGFLKFLAVGLWHYSAIGGFLCFSLWHCATNGVFL